MKTLYVLTALALAGCSTPTTATCTPACAAGYHCDNGACVQDTNTPDASAGDGGACPQACSGLTPYCNASGHCVGCTSDMQCPQGHYCKVQSNAIASCAIGCMSDDRCGGGTMKCCNMQCVDGGSDPFNCGQCGKACSAMHQSATCNNGVCAGGACDPGWGDCDGNPANGCEANLHVDPNNCTACGMKCGLKNAIDGCSDGCYIAACQFGWADCDNNMGNGCETSVTSDPNNCGGCGQLCKGLPNATANCAAGNCILGMCNQGFANCDGNPMNGCESFVATDPMNCGGCGNVCPMNMPFCNMNACTNVNPIKCSMAALNFCTGKMWTVPQGGTASGGRLYCTNNVGIGSDCNPCLNYNMIVWVNGAKPAFCQNFNYSTVAGHVYAGHSPCACGDNLLDCGTWPMMNCIPD